MRAPSSRRSPKRAWRACATAASTRSASAGPARPNAARQHYYRVQGPLFLIEYDASQDGGNHVHTVWRDFTGDFGRDLLREHYENAKGTAHQHSGGK